MGVDGKDILRWLQETADTLQGKNRNKPGGETTYKGIVQPLKAGADITGLTQGIKGMRPDASPMDQALALMVLGGMAAGPADDIVRGASRVGQAGKLKALDMFGPKAEMLHASPVSGITKFNPSRNAEALVGQQGKPFTYFLPKEKAIGNLPQYMAPGHRLGPSGKVTGSIYRANVPVHRLEQYALKSGMIHPYGRRAAIPVKVLEEKKFVNQGLGDVNDALRKWLNIKE